MNSYTGTDNLEVMADAVNYNRFLTDVVLSEAQDGDLILDFGAGIGTFSARIARHGYRVECVEPDPNQASVIAQSGLTVHLGLNEIHDESVDYVYLLNVLEHVEDHVGVLRAIAGKLKPGGRILIYVPAFEWLFSSMDRKVGHFRRYTRTSLANAAEDAGFTVVRTIYCDSLGFLAALAYKYVGDRDGNLNPKSLIFYDRIVFPLSRFLDKVLGQFVGKNCALVARKALK
jgi:SAM-dependent methyltransferase